MGEKSTAPLDMVMRVVNALGVTVLLAPATPAAPTITAEPIDVDEILDRVGR